MSPAVAPSIDAPASTATPFLKWAGGKRQLLPQIRRFYPESLRLYVEPFLGSGAVFFDLASRGLLDDRQVLLTDSNPDLIACYVAIRDEVQEVVTHLKALERQHKADGARFFYATRDQRFNPIRRRLARKRIADGAHNVELAAMMIYLNRTCFNGLFRLNAKGDFNTPAGRYVNPTICDEINLRNVSLVLNRPGVELRLADFSAAADIVAEGTFAYFDPPYAPLSKTSNFTSYTATGFADEQQERLRDLVVNLVNRGGRVLLSNSVAPITTALYATSRKAQAAGLRAYKVPARRAINCDGSSRGMVDEYLVSNVTPQPAHAR